MRMGSAPRMRLETLAATWGWQRAVEPPEESRCCPEDTGKPVDVGGLPVHQPLFTENSSWFSLTLSPCAHLHPTVVLCIVENWDSFQILITSGNSLPEKHSHTPNLASHFSGHCFSDAGPEGNTIRSPHYSLVTRWHNREENGVSDELLKLGHDS